MNVLLISSIYPGDDVPAIYTPVVHYFAKEWVQMGINVRVIHTSNYFPSIYYSAPSWFRSFIASRKGFALPEKKLDKEKTYVWEEVKVHRIPMKKMMPGKGFACKVMDKAFTKIVRYLEQEDFKPDYIIGHWVMPQAYLLYKLKGVYHSPTTLVLHDAGEKLRYYSNTKEIVDSIDAWGFRSEKNKKSFESIYGQYENSFRCLSGIPMNFMVGTVKRDWKQANRYVFAGMLIQRKHPDKLIQATHDIYGKSDYSVNIIGNGGMAVELELMVQTLGCRNRVNLVGRVDRHKVVDYLDSSDIFVMISENEVFGLVYIEAMARGCIVVASRGEGMQGIIEDGINGFLCNAGDVNELKDILAKIRSMSIQEKEQISINAMHTAEQYTDKNMAEHYIKSVENLCKDVKPLGGGTFSWIDYLRYLKRRFYIRKYGLKNVHKTFIATKKCSISKDFTAGAYSYVGPNCYIYPKVTIGKYTMLANDVKVIGGDHNYKRVEQPIIFSGRDYLKPTMIGDDVWIGAHSIVMTGVKIGNGVVVAAGSVVTKDLASYGIYGGIPAKLIKMRFTEEEIVKHKAMLMQPILKARINILCAKDK